MSASSKFDLSSGSPDRPLYTSSHRGSYGASSLDRSGSFREKMENPLLSSLPNMSRSSSSVSQGDVLNFFQCVRVDPKSVVVDHKLNRPAEFKQLASAAVGMPLEDSLPPSSKSKHLSIPSLEDFRCLKSGVRESGTKARERVKIFNDCLSVINKCFPTIPSRKRSRLDALPNYRSNTLLSIDLSASGMGVAKMGSQNHASMSSFELEQQNSEERTRSTIPSKRTRTSMVDSKMDAWANSIAIPPGSVDKGRDAVRHSNSSKLQGEDRTLSIAVDGWENSKMKKKRTGIKLDAAVSSVTTKPGDSYREPKQGTHPRLPAESRSRLADPHVFRFGIANGGMGLGRTESTSHSQTSSGMRSTISRTDSDNISLLRERREHSNGQEKERVNLKAVNKENSREDFSSGSPTSGLKLNTKVRAPRTGLIGGVSKLSQVVQQSVSSNDWDLSNCTNKITGVGANSLKRAPSKRSSSPVTNWVQRPQKSSRTARTNLLPIIPGNDDSLVMDSTSDMVVNERCFPDHSPQQVKIKSDNISPAVLSESEESGAAEVKSTPKNKKYDDSDEKSVQKISNLLLPPRKSKAVGGNDHGDGVRRQGRAGRGVASSRSPLPLSREKHRNVGTTKQIRSSRLGIDKTERLGRPPTRKLSDRKAYTRQNHVIVNTIADFLREFYVGSDDGHEELLAAANAVTNTAQALSSPFWKKMEPLFRFISDMDISYLKEQVDSSFVVETLDPLPLYTGSCTLNPERWSNECRREEIEDRSLEHLIPGAKKPNEISLYQRVVAALIPEEGTQGPFCGGEEDLIYNLYESNFEIEKDMGSDTFCSQMSPNCDPSGCPTLNGYDVKSNGRSHYELENNIMSFPNTGTPSYDHLQNVLHEHILIPTEVCTEHQYRSMSISERLLMEVHSIGMYPDLVSGDEEISGDINMLDEKYTEQVSQKKSLLGELLFSASEAKKLQQKEFEGHALDRLVGIAYEKYMGCWGPNAPGTKGANGKMAKQAALGFVKCTIERYQEFEKTGKSCFNDPLFKDMFLSGVSRLVDGQPLSSSTDNDTGKLLGPSGCSMEVRVSAPLGSQKRPTLNNQDIYSSEAFLSTDLVSEQTPGKEDSWSNRVKRRELLLDGLGGNIITAPGVASVVGGSLSCSAKGKRRERDIEVKGKNRDAFSRSGTTKNSRPGSTSVKGERVSKAKPKQKTTHSSPSVPLVNVAEQAEGMLSPTLKSSEISRSNSCKDRNDYTTDMLEEPIDLSGLQLPDMDDLGVAKDLGGQGEDIGSWLMNIEDDGFQDNDCMGGLGSPMDDLTELNMMV